MKTSAWRYVVPLGTAFPIALLVLATLGGLSETGLIGIPIVPWYTLFGLPIDLVIRDIATACTVGFALIGGVLAPRPDPYLGKLTSAAALVWLAALISQAVFTVSEVLALPLSGSFDPIIMRSLLTQTTVGQVILGQIALVALIALLGWVVLGRTTGWIVLGIAVVAAYLPGLTGHSGIQEGHTSATIALGFHLVSMAVWIGGLIAITLYALRAGVASEKVIRTYSTIALIAVIVIAESGLVNASMRIDGIAPFLTSPYGAVIIAKVAILIVLIGFGWQHRQNLTRLDSAAVPKSLAALASIELLWMGVVIGLAVALSRTAPPANAIAGEPFEMGSLAGIAIFLPVAIFFAFPRFRGVRVPRFFVSYAEVSAIVLGVVIYGATELSRTGALASVIGVQVSALVIGIVLLGSGVFAILVQWQSNSISGLIIIGLLWCGNAYWLLVQTGQGVTLGAISVTAAVLGSLAFVWWASQPQLDLDPSVRAGQDSVRA
ncbi:MAG: CopD family protein [Candidatus Nanopelagicales bacterium]